jgi:hypothetical protein
MINLYQYKFIKSFAFLIISAAGISSNFSISNDAETVSA